MSDRECDYSDVDSKKILPIISNEKFPGMIVVYGYVNGKKTLIQLDTGKSRTCVDEKLIKELDLPATDRGYKINEIKLGPYTFNVESAKKVNFNGISQGYPEPIMLGIGSDIISKMILTVDYYHQKIIVDK